MDEHTKVKIQLARDLIMEVRITVTNKVREPLCDNKEELYELRGALLAVTAILNTVI